MAFHCDSRRGPYSPLKESYSLRTVLNFASIASLLRLGGGALATSLGGSSFAALTPTCFTFARGGSRSRGGSFGCSFTVGGDRISVTFGGSIVCGGISG